jgi:4-carboxymuconolactone decarboxylase
MPGAPDRPLPKDVNRETLSRLSPLRREALGAEAQAHFDALKKPSDGARNLAGLQGPGGILIRMAKFGRLMGEANRCLRSDMGLSAALTEVVILASAREMDSQFEWTMHEPVALRQGVPAAVVEAIKYRKPLDGLPEAETAVIALARESIGAKKVSSATYARLLAAFGEEGLLAIVAILSSYAMTAILLATVDQHLHDGQQPLLPEH